MGEDLWPLVRMNLFKKNRQWLDEYAILLGGYEWIDQLKKSLLVNGMSIVSYDIPNTFFPTSMLQ